ARPAARPSRTAPPRRAGAAPARRRPRHPAAPASRWLPCPARSPPHTSSPRPARTRISGGGTPSCRRRSRAGQRPISTPGVRDQPFQPKFAGPAHDEAPHLGPLRLTALDPPDGANRVEQVFAVGDREPAGAILPRSRHRLALPHQLPKSVCAVVGHVTPPESDRQRCPSTPPTPASLPG